MTNGSLVMSATLRQTQGRSGQWNLARLRIACEVIPCALLARHRSSPTCFDTEREEHQRKLEAVEQLAKLAATTHCTLPQLAIALTLSHPAVTNAVLGLVDRFDYGGRGRLAPDRPSRGDFKKSTGGTRTGPRRGWRSRRARVISASFSGAEHNQLRQREAPH